MAITPKLKKPLSSLTRLERERAIRRLQAQNDELLEELGQESDLKAIGTVREYYKEQEEEQMLQKQEQQEVLKKLLRSKIHYQRYLCNILQIFLYEEDIPKKYHFTIESNDQGIMLLLEGSEYHQAFSVSGMPKYDMNACKTVAVQAGNTIARLEGNFQKTESGIIVTNKEEADLVLRQHGRKKGKYERSN